MIFRGGCDLCFIESQIQELASCIPLRYDAGICKHKNEHTGVIEIMKVNQIGNLSERKRDNPSQNRVYDDNGLAPTLNCCGGWWTSTNGFNQTSNQRRTYSLRGRGGSRLNIPFEQNKTRKSDRQRNDKSNATCGEHP